MYHIHQMSEDAVDKPGRIIAYVDGFNLYFGLKSQNLQSGYWLDIPRLMGTFLLPGQQLVATKYFTSRISGPPEKSKRQTDYLEALATLPQTLIYYGQYHTKSQHCRSCGAAWPVNREKMTDVNIAVELMKDAIADKLDIAYLVSADSDLTAPIQAFRDLWPAKRILAIFPPGRGSVQLAALVHGKRRIRRNVVMQSQLPDVVIGPDGHIKSRPPEWKREQ